MYGPNKSMYVETGHDFNLLPGTEVEFVLGIAYWGARIGFRGGRDKILTSFKTGIVGVRSWQSAPQTASEKQVGIHYGIGGGNFNFVACIDLCPGQIVRVLQRPRLHISKRPA